MRFVEDIRHGPMSKDYFPLVLVIHHPKQRHDPSPPAEIHGRIDLNDHPIRNSVCYIVSSLLP